MLIHDLVEQDAKRVWRQRKTNLSQALDHALQQQSKIQGDTIHKYGLEFKSPMKWTILIVQTLQGVKRITKRTRQELKKMNLLVLVITTNSSLEREETEKSRLTSIMKSGKGQFHIQILAVPDRRN